MWKQQKSGPNLHGSCIWNKIFFEDLSNHHSTKDGKLKANGNGFRSAHFLQANTFCIITFWGQTSRFFSLTDQSVSILVSIWFRSKISDGMPLLVKICDFSLHFNDHGTHFLSLFLFKSAAQPFFRYLPNKLSKYLTFLVSGIKIFLIQEQIA